MIHVDRVSKSYCLGGDDVHALRTTTLDVQPGEFVAVIGPSGSGKSTLLSMLGGMLSPTNGRVVLDGESLYDVGVEQRAEVRNRKIGFVFQNFNLIPWLNAVENVELPLRLYGSDRTWRRNTAEQLLERFGLADRMTHRPSELSAGQQQRVALARTLATSPRLILADEPTGNLDSQTRDLVIETLSEQCQEDRAVILVTHDEAVSAMATRVLHISDGSVTEQSNQSAVA
jgi:putative ABC transport system ATP-binding protein